MQGGDFLRKTLGDLEAIGDLGKEGFLERAEAVGAFAPIQCGDLVAESDTVGLETACTRGKGYRRGTPCSLRLGGGYGDDDDGAPRGDLVERIVGNDDHWPCPLLLGAGAGRSVDPTMTS